MNFFTRSDKNPFIFNVYLMVASLVTSSASVFAHNTHLVIPKTDQVAQAFLNEVHLIDRGDGQAQWMPMREAMKLSQKAHESGRCGGFFDLTDQPEQFALPAVPFGVQQFTLALSERSMTQGRYLAGAINQIDMGAVQASVKKLSSYRNRYYQSDTGVQAANWIASEFKRLGQGRNDVQVELFAHKWKQPSVIATIKGSSRANEIVVIGGHEDSINGSAWGSLNMDAPGADDDASGVATILEIFRVISQSGYQPERTLKFMTYAAEEVGLRGSQDIANQFKQQGQTVVAVTQLDMTAYPGAGAQVVFMTDFVNPDLTKFSQRLMDTYVKAKWGVDKCGYACSDHASWTKAGYPAIMPFESTTKGMNGAIHTTKDLISALDFAHGSHFAKLGLAFMAELGKDTAR
jgi:leucyl aminopeptidase